MDGVTYSFLFFKQKTAYEMRISDWSSDVCSSDLLSVPTTSERRRGLPSTNTGSTRAPLRRAISASVGDHGGSLICRACQSTRLTSPAGNMISAPPSFRCRIAARMLPLLTPLLHTSPGTTRGAKSGSAHSRWLARQDERRVGKGGVRRWKTRG